jgi:hypothetical protein
MIDIGVARPSAQGQAMISTLTAATSEGKRGSAPDRPGGEGGRGDNNDQRHEPARNLVGKPLDGGAAALGLGHHLHDAGEHGVAADLFGLHDEAAGGIEGAADHFRSGLLGYRHGFARHHRFVDRHAAFDDGAIDRHLLSGPHPQPVAQGDRIEGDLFIAVVGLQSAGSLRRQIEERANSSRGLLAGPQFENLAEQHQNGNHRRRLEIDGDRAVRLAESAGKICGRAAAMTCRSGHGARRLA